MEKIDVDCGTCTARSRACADCVISVLMGMPDDRPARVELDADEKDALDVLAAQGMVPPLRLVRAVPEAQPENHPQQTRRAL